MIVIKSRQEEQASRKTYSSRTTLYNEEDRDRLVRIMPGVFGGSGRFHERHQRHAMAHSCDSRTPS